MNKEIPNLKILQKLKEDLKQGKTLITFTTIQTIGSVLGMAAPLVVAKLFSEEMWGRYTYCEPVIFFFSALLITSSKPPFIVCSNEERAKIGGIRKSFSIQCIFFAASICLFLIVLSAFQKYIIVFAKIKSSELVYIALAFFAFITKDFVANIFMALKRRIANALLEFSFGTLTIALITLFYFLNWKDLKSVFLSYFLASLLILTVSLFVIDFKILLPLTFDRKQFHQMLIFTLWMIAGTISSYIINWVGIILLKYNSNPETGGTYNFAFKFFKGFTILSYILATYFLPHISENLDKPDKIKMYLHQKRPKILLLGGGCLLLAWLIIPGLLNLLYPEKYNEAGYTLRILIIGNAAFLYTAMYLPVLGAMKIYKFQQIIIITQLILNIILSALLIPSYGISGAAIAVAISYIYLAIATEVYYRYTAMRLLG